MQIEVTAQNIEDYGLDHLSGNTKEDLLQAASEAARSGHTLYFKIPDAAASESRNIFDMVQGDVVDVSHDDRTNPIMGESQANQIFPPETAAEPHSCDLPENPLVFSKKTCEVCGASYTAESTGGGAAIWVQEGEIDE